MCLAFRRRHLTASSRGIASLSSRLLEQEKIFFFKPEMMDDQPGAAAQTNRKLSDLPERLDFSALHSGSRRVVEAPSLDSGIDYTEAEGSSDNHSPSVTLENSRLRHKKGFLTPVEKVEIDDFPTRKEESISGDIFPKEGKSNNKTFVNVGGLRRFAEDNYLPENYESEQTELDQVQYRVQSSRSTNQTELQTLGAQSSVCDALTRL
ncbi:hypothetical protein PoB_000968200 [Plakobranchus ocellatus]|uniref:Uncharacterized protein n=1 Tax=Plakobranchus ocellatus TaxID=259542 RepID=A0AAV3YJY3_9GAST|nr:hypothetical protein PoB_000968200 [Plakobranchus ocellatus]